MGGRQIDGGGERKQGPDPVPSCEETTTWALEAFNAITEDDIRAACRAAHFPKGMKLSELQDVQATVGVGTALIWYLILIRYKCSAAT